MALDLTDAKNRYHHAMSPEDRARLPFYSALLNELEHSDTAVALLALVRVEQRNPMLILAALHLNALRGHPVLAPIYFAARSGSLDDPVVAARRVVAVLEMNPELIQSDLHRSTQTNEPGRSSVLQGVLHEFSRLGYSSIRLVDVGTSAGLNLYLDHYQVRAVDDGNPVTLVCEDMLGVDRSNELPVITERIGIDPSPLSLQNPDDILWLTACIWPEESRRIERFEAITQFSRELPALSVLHGSVLERLDEAIGTPRADVLTVVVNTWVAYYFSGSERERYIERIRNLCRHDNVAWISIEHPLVVIGPTIRTDGVPPRRGASRIVVSLPGRDPAPWGWCHPHGHWLSLDVPKVSGPNA